MTTHTSQVRQRRALPAFRAAFILPFLLLAMAAASWAQGPEKLRIGIIADAAIRVTDESERGFEAALAGAGFKAGENVIFDRQDSAGDPLKSQAIAHKFSHDKVDLIHSFGTPATLAVLRDAPGTPIIFSAVTDPVGSGIVPGASAPAQPTGTVVTGVSDRWPVDLQMKTYTRILPKARTWGAIYNPDETNSKAAVRDLRKTAQDLGLQLVEVTVHSTQDVGPAIASLVGKVDAVYLPADNTVGAAFDAITEVAGKGRLPFFSGDAVSVARGGLAAFGVDYFLVGYAAGKKAAQVLRGAPPGAIDWEVAGDFSLLVNLTVARRLGIVIPAEMLRIADRIVE